MPNLRGANPVGRDGGGSLYVARTDSWRTESAMLWSAAFDTGGEMLSPVDRAGERAEHDRRAGCV